MKSYYFHIVFILTTVWVTSCSEEKPVQRSAGAPVTVTLSTPFLNNTTGITASGQLNASEAAILSTRIMGFIQAVHAKPGETVKKGQLLISIASNDILAKKAQAEAMVSEAEAALADAKKDLIRYQELYKQQSASQKELENMTLRHESIEAKAEAAKQMLRETEAMLAYTRITAPFEGVVTQKMASEGNMTNPGMPLLILEKKGTYEVTTSVAESDISSLTAGMPAVVLLKSNGQRLTGKVSEISPSSSYSGGRYGVKVALQTIEATNLYAGMAATIIFSTPDSASETPLIPVSALVYKDQLVGVYTVSESNTALLRWVRTGKKVDDKIEILSGLNAQEKFILKADGKLYNGVPVQPKTN